MPLNIDIQQILLHMFNFIILAVGLYILLYKPVKNFMDHRTAEIENKQQETDRLMQEAADKEKAYAELLKKAEEETQRKMEACEEQIRQMAELSREAAHREAEGILFDAREKAQEAEKRTVEELKGTIADIALMIASGILEREIGSKENEKIIRKSLEEWSDQND